MIGPAYYVGIDPGANGGLGIVRLDGSLVHCSRCPAVPAQAYQRLLLARDDIAAVYLEAVHAHAPQGLAHVVQTSPLLVNFGFWQGLLFALGLAPVLIHPHSWQREYGLHNWSRRRAQGLQVPTPLEEARRLWPDAPLQFKADDGKGVALLLAGLAARDARLGVDRAAMIEANQAQAQRAKSRARQRRKAEKAQANIMPWDEIGPPGASQEAKKGRKPAS
jgi:hypothetical protein